MEIKETKLYKEKISMNSMVSEVLLNEMDFSIGRTADDFIRQTFSMQLSAFVMAQLNERKTITVYRERPTFWEWLTRKPRSFTFEFNAKEVLKNPPTLPPGKSVMMYSIFEPESGEEKI